MTRRIGTGLFIALGHLALVAALLHQARSSKPEDTGVVEYMTYVVVPKAAAPAAREAPPPPVVVQRQPRPAVRTQEPVTPLAITLPAAPEPAPAETAQPAASSSSRLDMVALRAEAGRVNKNYVPEPFERVRAAESRLEAQKNDLGKAIADTKRPPCTKKYSGGTSLNLIALIPLAIDTITDTGCKW